MTTTFPVLDRPTTITMTGPSTVLDLPVAVAVLRGLAARIVPDPRGGPVIDSTYPLGAALVPHAPNLGAWVSTNDPAAIEGLRRLAGPAGTVVLDSDDHYREPGLSGADVAVVNQLSAAPTTVPLLLRLTADRRRLPRGRAAALAGFAIRLPSPGAELDQEIEALGAGCNWWRNERGDAHPVVLLRSASIRAATRAARGLHRWAAATGTPPPVIRLDITTVGTTIGASTGATVFDYAKHPEMADVVVDHHLPPTYRGYGSLSVTGPSRRPEC